MKDKSSMIFKRFYLIFGLLVVLSTTSSYGLSPNLREGDLIFVSLNCYACKLIQATSNSPFSHVAIITKDTSTGALTAVMAVEPNVVQVPLDFFYKNSLIPPQVMRMKSQEDQAIASLASEMAKYYLGTPYDSDFTSASSNLIKHFLDGKFVVGPEKVYCSDLISYSFFNATSNVKMPFPLVKMDFGNYKNEWATILGHPPPQGQLGISPGDIARSPDLMIVQ